MAKVKGTVFRAGKSKFGFYIKLDGDDAFYNTKSEPTVGEGDVVGIEYEQKGKSRNVKRVVVLEKGAGTQGSSGGSGGGGAARNESIVWQHSQEMAARVAGLLLSNGAVELPAKGADKRATAITGLVNELTYKFYVDAINPAESETFKAEAGVESESDEGAADEPDDEWAGDEGESEDASWE